MKVLIADALSPTALDIFRERGIDAVSRTGLSPAELKEIIGGYEGLAVRSATKVTRSSRRMCLDTELSEMSNGAATSVTRASPAARRCRMPRRVSSASAISVSSRSIGQY